MVNCPVDSCEYSDEKENSVVAHMSSSKGDHSGIGYQKARQMLEVHGSGSGSESAGDGGGGGGSAAAGASSVEFPEAESVKERTDTSGSCKNCGSDTIRYSEDEPVYLNGSFLATVEAGDEFCTECGLVVQDDGKEVELW